MRPSCGRKARSPRILDQDYGLDAALGQCHSRRKSFQRFLSS
jgi:hypothetical protein